MDEENKSEEQRIAEQKAVALKYDMQQDTAPRVVAKGKGHVAEHILATAQKNSIPVYQNKTLVNMLMALEIDREIPPELYKLLKLWRTFTKWIKKKGDSTPRRLSNAPAARLFRVQRIKGYRAPVQITLPLSLEPWNPNFDRREKFFCRYTTRRF